MSLDLSTGRLNRKAQRRILVLWLVAIVLGYAALNLLIARERERDEHQWEVQLGLVASAQSRAVSGWVENRHLALHNLSDNMSLKLYLTELVMGTQEGGMDTEPAEMTYLRNLLIASAELGGFSAPVSQGAEIRANVAPVYSAGIVVTDAAQKPIVSTRDVPPLAQLPALLRQEGKGAATLTSEPFLLAGGSPAVAFRVPVFGVQQDSTDAPMGYIFAVAVLGDAFYGLLRGIGAEEETAESLLLNPEEGGVRFFSALLNGTKAMELQVDAASEMAPVAALRSPGVLVKAEDYRGEGVLAIARPVEGTTWTLVRKIDARVAMKETTARAIFLHIAYVLATGFLSAGVVALWRNATAHRAKQVALHYKSLSHRIQKQEALLDLIAETTPIATYIVDEGGKYRYANRRAAEDAEMGRAEMPGKSMEAVLGSHRAARLLAANAEAMEEGEEQLLLAREEAENGTLKQVRQSRHIPLESIPLPGEETDMLHGVLVIDQDITDVVRGEERRARTLQKLIETLVAMVDRRDPNAAEHSSCVAVLAREVGKQMKLEDRLVGTAETAGRLMNIGKITVPETLLTAKAALKDEEKERIRASIQTSADLLEGIEFDGPVVETLRQSQTANPELVTAQIIAAVNDFVAMVSPRAWRGGMPVEAAIAEMMKALDGRYSRPVVVALANYLENGGGRKLLAERLKLKG